MAKPCVDHLGNMYTSEAEMCRAYKCSVNVYLYRKKQGMSTRQALMSKTSEYKRKVEITDHLGNRYNSKKEMCDAYGKDVGTYNSRILAGYTQEEALTMPIQTIVHCKDHLGNIFASEREMCRHYNMESNLVRRRLALGMSLEEALTKPVRAKTKNRSNSYKMEMRNY